MLAINFNFIKEHTFVLKIEAVTLDLGNKLWEGHRVILPENWIFGSQAENERVSAGRADRARDRENQPPISWSKAQERPSLWSMLNDTAPSGSPGLLSGLTRSSGGWFFKAKRTGRRSLWPKSSERKRNQNGTRLGGSFFELLW